MALTEDDGERLLITIPGPLESPERMYRYELPLSQELGALGVVSYAGPGPRIMTGRPELLKRTSW